MCKFIITYYKIKIRDTKKLLLLNTITSPSSIQSHSFPQRLQDSTTKDDKLAKEDRLIEKVKLIEGPPPQRERANHSGPNVFSW